MPGSWSSSASVSALAMKESHGIDEYILQLRCAEMIKMGLFCDFHFDMILFMTPPHGYLPLK